MADDTTFQTDTQPTLQQLADYVIDSFFDAKRIDQFQRAIANGAATAQTVAGGAAVSAADALLEIIGSFLFAVEKHLEVAAGPALARVAGHIIGRDVSIQELRRSGVGGEGSALGATIGKFALDALRGADGELQPGQAGAERLLGLLGQFVVNGWFETTAFEMLTTLFPGMDSFESIGELPREIIDALGLGRLARVALRPIAQTTIATPLDWQLNKTYRPTLLKASEAVYQLTRGRWSPDKVNEELARQGYSADRIEALIAAALKMLSADDAFLFLQSGKWNENQVIELLKAQGYEQRTAELVVAAHKEKRFLSIRDDALTSIRSAYVNRQISDVELSTYLEGIIARADERAAYEVAAFASRELNVPRLTHGEIQDAVLADILNFPDYRKWLDEHGYTPDDQLTLELLLRRQKDKLSSIEAHRQAAVAERAAEKAARDAAREAKRAAVEAELAQKRRGSATDLARAVVRGLIPIDRYREVLTADYDPDTVAIMVDLVRDDRDKYLAQQAAADEARQRAGRRQIDVGALDQAVLTGVLTVDEYRRRLAQLGFTDADAGILASTLAAKLADRNQAAADRREAAIRAQRRSIDLGRFEQLVRRGVRSLTEYDALLATLGFDDASRAAMRELLQLKIADDQAAAAARAGAEPKLRARGVSLEQLRRGVLLGLRTRDDYQAFLVQQGFTGSDVSLLMGELDDDLAQAEAARQRRQETAGVPGDRALPLSTIRRAVQLGVVSPDVYQARLVDAGYSPDDVSIEMDLLLQEIADVQAARARRAQLNADAESRGLSLAQIERAVKAGSADLELYRSRAAALGYAPADIELLASTLDRELATLHDAEARHAQIAGELATRDLSLAQDEAAVKAGLLTVNDYAGRIRELGYSDADAELLVSLLLAKLAAAPTP